MPKRKQTSVKTAKVLIVGIGASAGGITALQLLFQALSAEPNLSIVVIQHLTPGQASRLPEIVGRWATMSVRPAVQGESPERNCIYIASPDTVLTLEEGVFRHSPVANSCRRPGIDTIDAFLESLAQDRGRQAIAVVLSGTGNDGAAGAICVKRAGGSVLVQDPITAMHDSMPRAVIASGAADYILPPDGIAKQLMLCASPEYVRPKAPVSWTREINRTLDEIVGLIRKQTGLDLSGYKVTPLLWRVQQRMGIRRVRDFQDYEALLRDDPAELEVLIRVIPIHVTQFFRDPDAWEVLRSDVIEPLMYERNPGEQIRAWTPACATGEEAYSVAMLLSEYCQIAGKSLDFQVFATDASPEILARASRGAFSREAAKSIPPECRARFLYEVDGTCRIKRSLREKMVFAPQDLLSDPPFSNLDLVTCRNLLIYLDPDASKRVLLLLHSSLRLGGYLFLGKGESLPPRQRGFDAVSLRYQIYRKVGPASDLAIKLPSRPQKFRHNTAVPASAHRAAVEHFNFPSVLIDNEFNVLRTYGDAEKLLSVPAAGQLLPNLLDFAQSEFVQDLKLALKDALAERHSVTVTGLRDRESGGRSLHMRLTPLQTGEDGSSPRLLVSFLPAPLTRGAASSSSPAHMDDTRPWSEAVRISHEELEASREELQALNEELKASNEQLNIANEDLNQANAQLKEKIAALEMQSRVLSSGAVMTLFLDQELQVHWFTPAVLDLFPLRPADAGRHLTDFAPKFDDDKFFADVHAVMQTGDPREAEVESLAGRWFLRRIHPYLSEGKTVQGVAITFNDITVSKHAESALRESEARLAAELAAMRRLHDLSTAALSGNTEEVLEIAVDAMLALHGTDMGNIQLYDPERQTLRIVAQRGFQRAFLDHFAEVDAAEPSSCGIALLRQERVIFEDVEMAPSYAPSLAAARDAGYRTVQSTPLFTTSGEPLGMVSTHFRAPHAFTEHELKVTDLFARELSHTLERSRIQAALRKSEATLSADLAHMTLLRELAESLVTEDNEQKIYEEILFAAIVITQSHAGTVQVYDPETKSLVLLVTNNFERKMTDHFRHVRADSQTACGIALRTGQRTFIDFDAKADEACRLHIEAGYLSAQATPLVSRSGTPLGMLNTHWHETRHRPTERQLRFLDLLARQAADLLEQRQTEKALREGQQRLNGLLDSITDGIVLIDADWRYVYRNEAGRRFQEQQGLAPDYGIGQRVWDAVPTYVGTPVEAAMRQAMEDRQPTSVSFVFPPNQRRFDARVYPVPGGGISIFFADVMERSKA